jgi:aminoglycoside phosphotransferase (APT) family kinase protein
MDIKAITLAELGQPFAHGRTAAIYPWPDGRVLKLFHSWCEPGWVDMEYRLSRLVHAAGVPSPGGVEMAEIEGQRGVLFDRIDGPSMSAYLAQKPWQIDVCGRLLAELHAGMHSKVVQDLRNQRQGFEHSILEAAKKDLPERYRGPALKALEQLPDGQALCHGDYHPENVIYTVHGPVILDWMTACQGDPLADVARTLVILRVSPRPEGLFLRKAVEFLRHRMELAYLARYTKITGARWDDIKSWLLPVAAARWNEQIPTEAPRLAQLMSAFL